MTPKLRRSIQIGSFALMFTMLCALRLWYSIFLFIGVGLVMTAILRRRTYCSVFCPMGTICEWTDQKKDKGFFGTYIRIPVFILFFGYIGYILLTYQGYHQAVWYFLLRMVFTIAIFSILIQLVYKKRTWCTRLCPVGILLSFLSKKDGKGPVVNEELCVKCNRCTNACPLEPTIAPPNVTKVDTRFCVQCGACETACPHGAIQFK